jgi:hypothetical protein
MRHCYSWNNEGDNVMEENIQDSSAQLPSR